MAAKKSTARRGYRWMQIPTPADVERLRQLIAAKGPLWDRWEYKLHRDRIIIYEPVVPRDPRTDEPRPAERFLAMHLRVSPSSPGPFELEYRRHTEQWWPLRVVGEIEQIAAAIVSGTVPMTAPMGQVFLEPRAGGTLG